MTKHASHPAIIRRLKRAEGHLSSVAKMIEDGCPCLDFAQQLHAVEGVLHEHLPALDRALITVGDETSPVR